MDRLFRLLEIPARLTLWVGLIAGFLMMVHVTVDVAGRTLFNSPLPGTNEVVAAYYMILAAYMPWMWVTRTDSHIQVDLFVRLLPDAARHWLDVVVKAITLGFIGLFTWQSILIAITQTGRTEVWEAGGYYMLVWPSRWVLPIAGGLMALQLIALMLRDIVDGPRPERRDAPAAGTDA